MHLVDSANIQSPTLSIQSRPKKKGFQRQICALLIYELFTLYDFTPLASLHRIYSASFVTDCRLAFHRRTEKFPKLLLSFRFLFGVGKVGRHVVLSQFYDARVWHRILCLPLPSYSLHCSFGGFRVGENAKWRNMLLIGVHI